MSARARTWLANIGLATASALLTLVLLEFVVFRTVLVPDDLLENVTINGVVRYRPKSEATFRHPDGTTSLVRINADGWNSTRAEYPRVKSPGRTRIAVVGDSYVHAAAVDVDKAFPEAMARLLQSRGKDVEVFRFGMDGAPLSQYLNMLRREVLAFQPDIVVIPLIHNDFDESYRFLQTRYASSFMKLRKLPDGSVEEIAPASFRYGTADILRNSNAFRYVYYETGLYLHAKSIVSRMFWGGTEDWSPRFISSAVDIRKIRDHTSNRFFARYTLDRMRQLSREHGFKLLVAMDGVREAVYAGKPAGAYEVGRLNAIAADVTTELGLPFFDLHQKFEADFKTHGQRFEFPFDWHWNARANRLVAEWLVERLLSDPAFGLQRPARAAALVPPSVSPHR